MDNGLPPVGSPAALREEDGRLYPSRVEGVDDAALTVAWPSGISAATPFEPGAEFELTWASGSGIYAVPVRYAAPRTEGAVRLWDLEVVGAVVVEQRREYVRVPTAAAVTVTARRPPEGDMTMVPAPTPSPAPAAPDPAAPDPAVPATTDDGTDPAADAETDDGGDGALRGTLVDISEVAMQCRLPVAPSDERVHPGRSVTAAFQLAEERFVLDGTVHAVRSGDRATEARVVVVFQQPERSADRLRRQVFAIQVEMRRVSREHSP